MVIEHQTNGNVLKTDGVHSKTGKGDTKGKKLYCIGYVSECSFPKHGGETNVNEYSGMHWQSF